MRKRCHEADCLMCAGWEEVHKTIKFGLKRQDAKIKFERREPYEINTSHRRGALAIGKRPQPASSNRGCSWGSLRFWRFPFSSGPE
jgi:hypothetical protein